MVADDRPGQKGVELGAKNYDVNSYLDGEPSVTLAVFQLPGSNALETAEAIRDKMEELKADFPEGVDYRIVYDTTVFVDESITSVYHTLIEAFVLVFIVVLVFLQNWRATIIPMIAVPVSLIGTFAVMAVLGFSLNNLSLFGLVLAIGIVVDDAIVVVENVERWMAQGHVAARRGPQGDGRGDRAGHRHRAGARARCSCRPRSWPASAGSSIKQFALTIAASTVISAFNSLTLSPALCAHAAQAARPRRARPRIRRRCRGWASSLHRRAAGRLLLPGARVGAAVRDRTPAGTAESTATAADAAMLWALRGRPVRGRRRGRLVRWPRWSTRVLGALLPRLQLGLRRGDRPATARRSRLLLRVSVIVLLVYGGLIGLTVLGFQAVPDGLHPGAGQGLPGRQRPASRRRQPGAHRRGRRAA